MLWEDFSYFVAYLIQGCVTVFYMMQLLETRLPAVTTFCITMALNASVFLLFGVNNWDVVYTYRTLAMVTVQIGGLCVLYRGRPFLKALALASNYMWGFFPEVSLSFILHGLLGYSLEKAMSYPTKLYGMIVALLIYAVLSFSAIRPLQRFIFHREKVVEPLPLKTLLLFICFPIGQTLLLFACTYSMATGLHMLSNGSMISINCTAVEYEVANSRFQRSELDWLIYNDPLSYAELILNGDPEEYLRTVTETPQLDLD